MPTPRKPTPRKAAYKQVELPFAALETDRRIPLIVLAAIAAIMLLVLIFTQCSGPAAQDSSLVPASSAQASTSAAPAQEMGDVEPPENPEARASLEEYSWEELSQISRKISDAATSEDALYVARQYGLVNSEGKLDGNATKSVALGDGTTAKVRIIGFNHDEASDASGKVGLTFMFTDGVAAMPFNEDGSIAGGWPSSSASYYLGVDFYGSLPEDLLSSIVEVSKISNTGEEGNTAETGDVMWIPSYIEITGEIDPEFQSIASTLQQEGSQYQLFADAGVSPAGNNSLLVMHDGAQASAWWLRTVHAGNENSVCYVNAAGSPTNSASASEDYALVPCFCI